MLGLTLAFSSDQYLGARLEPKVFVAFDQHRAGSGSAPGEQQESGDGRGRSAVCPHRPSADHRASIDRRDG